MKEEIYNLKRKYENAQKLFNSSLICLFAVIANALIFIDLMESDVIYRLIISLTLTDLVILNMVSYYDQRLFYGKISDRFWSVEKSIRNKAVDCYGEYEGMFVAIECSETHLPGDCPLCGAC